MILRFPKKLLRSWNRSYVHSISRIRQRALVSCASDEKKTKSWGKKFWKSAKIPHTKKLFLEEKENVYKKNGTERIPFSSRIKNLIYLVASWLSCFAATTTSHKQPSNRLAAICQICKTADSQRRALSGEWKNLPHISYYLIRKKSKIYIYYTHNKNSQRIETGHK